MIVRRYMLGVVVAAAALGNAACSAVARAAAPAPDRDPAWVEAHQKPPMTADQTRAFIMRLARFVVDHHLKRAEQSPQRGMIYEYFRVARQGQHDQFIQGEGLDTMHDGAWFAAAMVNACRATGDPFYKELQQYRYYVALARRGAPSPPTAFRVVYDAFTLPKLYQTYSDDSPVPPGINVFDLHPHRFLNGKPADYRSQRKGPLGGPRPIGSRFGPQNMVVCGWALQVLRADQGLWEAAQARIDRPHYFPTADTAAVIVALERELAGGLRTWEAVFDANGYIPTDLGAGNCGAGFRWDELSDTGGYAHLISAAAQWLLYLEGKNDWTVHHVPGQFSGTPASLSGR